MLKGPFQKREVEKYENLIPSRKLILSYLEKREKPISYEELVSEMNLEAEEQQAAFRRRLRAMERDGQLVFTRRQRYVLAKHLYLLRGKVIGHRDGYGFLRVEGKKDDFYLSTEQMKFCMHGDIILARLQSTDRKGRREVRVVRILEPRNSQIVGRYFTDAGVGFVVPDDSRLSFDILIPPGGMINASTDFIVVVEVIKRPTRRAMAIGRIVEVLGDRMSADLVVDMALRTYEIPHIWPDDVESQIATLHEEVSEEAKRGRVDLRQLPLITIDGEDACDFDDAVYCEKKRGGGWRLWVAVSDVSYYARPDSPLDKEAYNRGTSVYFPSQVVPMLPEMLSNGLCSLNPEVDRLCIVCEMTISANGKLTSYKHYEAVIKSQARLTYTKVWSLLKGNLSIRKQYSPLIKHLEELHRMCQVLGKEREQRGSILLETEEAKFIFNAEHRIERVERMVRNDAHKLIEECMILANTASARFVEKYQEPALFRDHERPSEESIKSFRSVLAERGLSLSGGSKPQPIDYAELLEIIATRPDYEMLKTMLLCSMKQAIYNPENRGHFGLALSSYAHFTSPIRRYPDLLLHRVIKYLLAKQEGILEKNNSNSTPTGGFHYDMAKMLHLGLHCSMTERRADEATRDVTDWLKCDFMKDQVGNTFVGMIISVTTFGFFVRLNDLFIDGLVHVSTLDNDYYRFDAIGQCLIGESSSCTYRLGDTVEVRVEAVHMDERKIDFSLTNQRCWSFSKHKVKYKKVKKDSIITTSQNKYQRKINKMSAVYWPNRAF